MENKKPPITKRLAAIRRRRRFISMRRLIIFSGTTILLLLFITGFFAPVFSATADAVDLVRITFDRGQGFPIRLNVPSIKDAVPIGDGFVAVGEKDLAFISATGKELRRIGHNLAKPLLLPSDNRVLLYSRGGNEVRIESFFRTIFEKRIEGSIYTAAIAKNGTFALAGSDARFRSSVVVYSNLGSELFTFKLADETPILVQFSNDARSLAIACVYAQNGVLKTKFYTFSITAKKQTGEVSDIDGLCVDLAFINPLNLLCVFDNAVSIINFKDKKITQQFNFGGRRLLLSTIAQDANSTAILLGEPQLPSSEQLILLDNKLSPTATVSPSFNIDNMYYSVYNLIVSADKRIFRFSSLGTYNDEDIILLDEKVLFLLPSDIAVCTEYAYNINGEK